MKLASYLNSTNVTEVFMVIIFYSFSPYNSINHFSIHACHTLQTTIRNNTCKKSILYLFQGELHLLSSYFSFYIIFMLICFRDTAKHENLVFVKLFVHENLVFVLCVLQHELICMMCFKLFVHEFLS